MVSRRKKIIDNIFIVLSSTLLAVSLAELFLRILNPYLINKKWDHTEQEEKYWDWEDMRELHTSLLVRGREDGQEELEYPLVHNHYRILAMGDSFTYGVMLKNSGTWPALTEKILHDKGFPNVEILNGGRPGTDTKWQYDFFKEYFHKYHPDMVIIGFLINDCTNLGSHGVAIEMKKLLDAELSKEEPIYSLQIVKYMKIARLKHQLFKDVVEGYYRPYENNSKEFQACKEAFLDFQKLSEQRGFKLIVVIYPMLHELNKNHPFLEIHKKMMSFWQAHNIIAYDLTPAFYGQNHTDFWLYESDAHPNRKANTIAAKRIAEIIMENLDEKSFQNNSIDGRRLPMLDIQ